MPALVKIRTNVLRSKRMSGKKADIITVHMERITYPNGDITQKPSMVRESITVTPEGVMVGAGDAQTIVGLHRRIEMVENTDWPRQNKDSLMAALVNRSIPFDPTMTKAVMVDLLENPPDDDDGDEDDNDE